MKKVTVDGVEHDFDSLSDNGKAQAASLEFLAGHMKQLESELQLLSTAREAYFEALRAELKKL